MKGDLASLIFDLKDNTSFTETALKIFRYQSEHNPVYKAFISSLGKSVAEVESITEIPFLPVEFFKSQTVLVENLPVEMVFESSRTTGAAPSRHFVHDLKVYETSFLKAFLHFYGEPSEYFMAALLPSYVERESSSLLYMMNTLIKKSLNKEIGFYADNFVDLIRNINKAKSAGQKTFLIGVSFALLDLAEKFSPDFSGTIVMETGGMKGRRKEITRMELHNILMGKLNVHTVHSEYGMTELMSQAYSKGSGIFYCPPWMKIMIRDPHDPLSVINECDKAGGINIIDLANIYSCSFISTGDFGKLHESDGFEVSGRFDNSDIRGCNLMAE
jgi:hypothetical protein